MADKGLGLERRRLRGKSKVKIPRYKTMRLRNAKCDSSGFLSQKYVAMASFKKVQEMLCLCLIEGIIGEEEFVLLSEVHRPSNLPFPHSAYEKFSLANKDPAECKADFRVEKRDIPLLIDALRVPPVYNAEEIFLPVPVFQHDTHFWTIRARTKHD